MTEEAQVIIAAFKKGNKLLVCGNGGSLDMASHFCSELVSHYTRSYPAIPLTNPVIITAIANDSDYSNIFSRQIKAYGKQGDVLILLTTSTIKPLMGRNSNDTHSLNIVLAREQGKNCGMSIVESPRVGETTEEKQEYQLRWLHQLAGEIDANYVVE